MIPKLRKWQNLRRQRGIFVIVCGICRGVDRMQFSKWHYCPRKPQNDWTKIKPVLLVNVQVWQPTQKSPPLDLGLTGCGRHDTVYEPSHQTRLEVWVDVHCLVVLEETI